MEPTYGPAYRPSPGPGHFEQSPRSTAPPQPLTIEEPKTDLIGPSENDQLQHLSNTSPIDSTASSGYHSHDIDKCVSPPMPTPNEIRYFDWSKFDQIKN